MKYEYRCTQVTVVDNIQPAPFVDAGTCMAMNNTDNIVLDGGAAAAFVDYQSGTSEIKIKPGGLLVLAAPKTGFTVTATTADILAIKNSSGSVTASYKLIVLGTSA